MTAPERTILDVQDLGIDLHLESATVPVVSGVTFQVSAGEILGVVGESGSGKSLTALSVMRMLPAAASVTSGTIRYQGRDVLDLPEPEMTGLRGGQLGMVFQDPMAFLNPLMTVGQQIREALLLHGLPRDQVAARTVELLRLVGVRDPEQRVHDYPHQFSGGMRQRVIIAIAVANNPTLLLADEPTSALDVTVQAEILRLLARLRDELDTALVLITHDIGVVQEVCDSVLVMYAGRVVEHGRAEDVLGDPQHPYTRELMRSTPRLDLPVQPRLPAIPGKPPDVMSRPGGCPFHPRCPLVMDRCRDEEPPLTGRAGGSPHEVACWAPPDPLPPATAVTLPVGDHAHAQAEREAILQVDDARISYHNGRRRWWRRTETRPVVDGVSLHAYPGQTLGLVGESGCGKSTLAKAIMGLLPVDSGTIRINGREWTHLSREERGELRRTIQMVFQDSYSSLNPRQTVRELLTELLVVHRLVARSLLRSRVEELVALVGLPRSVLDRYPYQLSGGQRQRVGIARALAMEPRMIVADEPVSALDVSVQAQIVNLLADLRDQLGLGYVVIAHDLSVVRHLCEEVAVMQDGRIVEHASADSIFTDPQHPYTISLLAASPGSPWTDHRSTHLAAGSE